MSTKGLNKTVTMVTGLGKKLAKATVTLVPAATVIANIADIASTQPDLASGAMEFVKRYSAVDIKAGKLDLEAFMKGGGALIITGLFSKVVKDLT